MDKPVKVEVKRDTEKVEPTVLASMFHKFVSSILIGRTLSLFVGRNQWQNRQGKMKNQNRRR